MLTGKTCIIYNNITGKFEKAKVVCWYGYRSEYMLREYGELASRYPSLIDVIFENDNRLSKGHFVEYAKFI